MSENTQMTMLEALDAKARVEDGILALLTTFTKETHLSVEAIHLETVRWAHVGTGKRLGIPASVKLEVHL